MGIMWAAEFLGHKSDYYLNKHEIQVRDLRFHLQAKQLQGLERMSFSLPPAPPPQYFIIE